jgi:hypothetical protein
VGVADDVVAEDGDDDAAPADCDAAPAVVDPPHPDSARTATETSPIAAV